jgi:hypothetical protein
VIVEAGYVLGPYGHEILIEHDVEVDLCHETIDGNAASGCAGADPWCSDIRVGRPGGRPLYLAIRYDECESRPVRAHGQGCGCNEGDCQYSRVRDSFAIKLLLDLPSSYADPMPQPDIERAVSCGVDANGNALARTCPPCPPEPWVVLADITLNDDGTLVNINCFTHRRYVAAFADFYFLCRPQTRAVAARQDILTDLTAQRENAAPAATLVGLSRPDGSVSYLPVRFDVMPGETFASFVSREGDRQFADMTTGEVFSLRDLYATAGVDPTTTLNTQADATAILGNVTLRLGDLRDTRDVLNTLLDLGGIHQLDSEYLGAPTGVTELDATGLRGVGPDSALGQQLTGTRVGEIAALSRAAFVNQVVEAAPTASQDTLRRQAGETWDNAAAAVQLTRVWRAQSTGQ